MSYLKAQSKEMIKSIVLRSWPYFDIEFLIVFHIAGIFLPLSFQWLQGSFRCVAMCRTCGEPRWCQRRRRRECKNSSTNARTNMKKKGKIRRSTLNKTLITP